jgi:magnesium chelatase subunit D
MALSEDAPSDGVLARWADAVQAAALMAVDPHGLGGVALQAAHGPVRDRWLAQLRALLPADRPMRRVPAHVRDDRLLGGLDLAATLQAGRPVSQTGLLAEADGGVLVLAMAERLSDAMAARIGAALDEGRITVARDGLQEVRAARIGIVALDEGVREAGSEESPPARLLERLAFRVDLTAFTPSAVEGFSTGAQGLWADTAGRSNDEQVKDASAGEDTPAQAILAAQARLGQVTVDDATLEALCATAEALGIDSLRAPVFAVRAARAAAALDGRLSVEAHDAALAARLVLGPRATRLPPQDPADDAAPVDASEPTPPSQSEPAPPDASQKNTPPTDDPTSAQAESSLEDRVLDAARAAIPQGLLALLSGGMMPSGRGRGGGRMGAQHEGRLRGRPAGTRPGQPRDGGRLALIDTLRAAAPWQSMRRAQRPATRTSQIAPIEIRASDFRIARLRERRETTTIFAVDASGSAALHRLAEAKGAVELLLAECYVRRDRVAVVAFRGRAAEVLLAPTRSLTRAKRSLAGLPGGGGTPLAAGIDAVADLADATARRGGTPVIVLLTDGRANVARNGTGGRAQADADARLAARRVRLAAHPCMLIDTSPQPQALGRALAAELGGTYMALPHADADKLSRAVQAVSTGGVPGSARGR